MSLLRILEVRTTITVMFLMRTGTSGGSCAKWQGCPRDNTLVSLAPLLILEAGRREVLA